MRGARITLRYGPPAADVRERQVVLAPNNSSSDRGPVFGGAGASQGLALAQAQQSLQRLNP